MKENIYLGEKNIYFHENNLQKVNSTTALFPLKQAVFMWFEIKKGAYTPPISSVVSCLKPTL